MTAATIYNQHSSYWSRKATLSEGLLKLVRENVSSSDVALDVGCGGGRLTQAVAPMVMKVVGVDFSSDLIQATARLGLGDDYIMGDIEEASTWKMLPKVDVVVSNVAIRKDHCRLNHIIERLREHQGDRPVRFILRIQSAEDLPGFIDPTPFYTSSELQSCFGQSINLQTESFQQRFSSPEYLHKFLTRIGAKMLPDAKFHPGKPLRLQRRYHLVVA